MGGGLMSKPVYRCHYRGRLEDSDAAQLVDLLQQCEQNAQQLINDGALMTAALYYYGNQLFLYYEAVGEEIRPERFMAPLHPVLSQWPQKEDTCDWALMYNVFWHDAPKDDEDWKRSVPPERRRGRIAWLKHDTMFRYVYHHFAIAEEGILQGDRVDSGCQHTHVIGTATVHARALSASPDIACSNDNRNFNACLKALVYRRNNFINEVKIKDFGFVSILKRFARYFH
jgi:hypothetical protein